MKKSNGKLKILLCYSLFIVNLLGYSLTRRHYHVDSFLFMLWAFSNYITLFISFFFVEIFVQKLNISKKTLFKIIVAIVYLIVFCLGFAVSVCSELWSAVLIISIILVVSFFIFYFLFTRKLSDEKVVKNSDNVIDYKQVEDDITNSLIKHTTDDKVNNSFALACGFLVYPLYLIYIIFANVVCHDVLFWHIIFEICLGMLCLTFNLIKQIKMQCTIKDYVIESSLLLLGLASYLVVEWIFVPVTFNILLVFFAFMIILPIHFTMAKMATKHFEYYGKVANEKKENNQNSEL